MNVVATTSSDPSKARSSILNGADSNTAENRLTTLAMDVTDESTVAETSKAVSEKFGSNLRLLVNLSGIVSTSPGRHTRKGLNLSRISQ